MKKGFGTFRLWLWSVPFYCLATINLVNAEPFNVRSRYLYEAQLMIGYI